jgi:hypothetical protein
MPQCRFRPLGRLNKGTPEYSKRGKCRSFFNIKAKQPLRRYYSTLDQKTQAISYILSAAGRAAQRGGKDRAAAVKFQAARCDILYQT